MTWYSPTNRPDECWRMPPKPLSLGRGEVHVWRGIVDIPVPTLQVFEQWLSSSERERAGRFRFPQHRHRFIAARGMLRSLLGKYLGLSPEDIELGIGPHGKPFVRNHVITPLFFNMSHSQKVALCAFSLEAEVGIDVEGPHPTLEYEGVAKRIFSPQERLWVTSLSPSQKRAALLRAWTRKEAFVKALGTGLTFPLQKITVTLLPHQPPQLVHIADPTLSQTSWSLYALHPRRQYTAALVVAGTAKAIHLWDYHHQSEPSPFNEGSTPSKS